MQDVCFTGRGKVRGNLIQRKLWEAYASDCDFNVVNRPTSSDCILVASSYSTSKATDAKRLGAQIMSYEEWEGHLYINGFATTHERYMDVDDGRNWRVLREERKREAQAGIEEFKAKAKREQEELEANPAWGTWG